ncbi:MAG: hypothetical protein KKG04_01230, partial [Candidatus Thermoplasmatota archaeon]|nr:hypothetical protein [Candidatus Thermoplasmatota archaeon]
MKLYDLGYACHIYPRITDFDASYKSFLDETNPALDILNHQHRKALFVWLNSWGCRQFALDFHDTASDLLKNWGQKNIETLPSIGNSLLSLKEDTIRTA